MRSIFWKRPAQEEARVATSGWRLVWVWLPALIATAVIAGESTPTFSAENTSGWIRPWFEHIFGHVNDHVWFVGHYLARKTGHFTGYGTVCLTYLRAWLFILARKTGLSVGAWRLRACALGVASTFCVASLDEWHQTYLPTRTGAFSDVMIDTVGASIACGLVWLVFWSRRR
jgi:hypothetical protein